MIATIARTFLSFLDSIFKRHASFAFIVIALTTRKCSWRFGVQKSTLFHAADRQNVLAVGDHDKRFSTSMANIGLRTGMAVVSAKLVVEAAHLATDEGAKRSMKFWLIIFPIWMRYRLIVLLSQDVKLLKSDKAMQLFSNVHEKHTDKVRDLIFSLRGFYLKVAQLISIQDDFVPEPYMRWIKDTQDNVPSEFGPGAARAYVAEVLRSELGLAFDDVFEGASPHCPFPQLSPAWSLTSSQKHAHVFDLKCFFVGVPLSLG